MYLQVPPITRHFFIRWGTNSFWRTVVLRFIFELNPKQNHIPFIFKCPGGVLVFTSRLLQYMLVDFPTPDYLNLVLSLSSYHVMSGVGGTRWLFLIWHLFQRKLQPTFPEWHIRLFAVVLLLSTKHSVEVGSTSEMLSFFDKNGIMENIQHI